MRKTGKLRGYSNPWHLKVAELLQLSRDLAAKVKRLEQENGELMDYILTKSGDHSDVP